MMMFYDEHILNEKNTPVIILTPQCSKITKGGMAKAAMLTGTKK